MRESMRHVITGEPALVWAALSRANEDGRLVRVEQGRQLAGGRVQLVAQLRPVPGRSRWELVRPWLVRVAKLAAVLAAVGGLVWLLVLAVLEVIAVVTAAVAWVQAHLAVLAVCGVALLVLFAAAMSSGSRCGGLHCGGCRR